MTTVQKPELEFLSSENLSLRAVDQNWIRMRAAQIKNEEDPDQPNIEAALMEAIEILHSRLGCNAKQDEPVKVFCPSNDTDPYVVGITIDQRPSFQKRMDRPRPTGLPESTYKEGNLREEFENLLFEELSLEPSVLEVDERGRYKTHWVNARWEGFMMYQRKLVVFTTDKHKSKYNKTLGRYVVGKVAKNGTAVFTAAPFRHVTKAQAIEEANRLSVHHAAPFAIFRCLDIIDSN